jgi:hypothetical protein
MSKPDRRWFLPGLGVQVAFLTAEGKDSLWKKVVGTRDHVVVALEPHDLDDVEIRGAYEAWLTEKQEAWRGAQGGALALGPPQTPLSAIDIDPDLAEEMAIVGIECVEALAALQSTHCARIPRGQEMKRKAAAYLADHHVPPAIRAELAKLHAEIDALRAQITGGSNG